jgi:hypothetical protein
MTQAENTTPQGVPRAIMPSRGGLLEAVREAITCEVRRAGAIRAGETRGSPMFMFCHSLKSHDKFAALNADQAAEKVAEILSLLYGDQLDYVDGDPWHAPDWQNDCEDPQSAFLVAWDKALLPKGIFGRCVALAQAHPVGVPGASTDYSRFLALCAVLQEAAGTLPIPVAVTTFAEALGVSPRMVSTYSQLAQKKRLLKKVAEATFSRAAEYFFDIGRLNELLGKK